MTLSPGATPEPIWLRAADEAAAVAALPMLRDAETGDWRCELGHLGYLDIIEAIEVVPAVFDEDGNLVTPAELVPGWHANFYLGNPALPEAVALAETVAASGLAIARPNKPARVQAGYVVPQSEGSEEEGA
ncbi:MAG: hypothetical protein KBC46_03525 [Ferrovibrio sp.]|nr:hypothetical protein [Ferrovibrio sp.]